MPDLPPLVPVLQFPLVSDAVAAAAVLVRAVPVLQTPLASDAVAAVAAASSPLLPELSTHLGLRSRVFVAGEFELECLRRSPRPGS